jgi:hypothetical protein
LTSLDVIFRQGRIAARGASEDRAIELTAKLTKSQCTMRRRGRRKYFQRNSMEKTRVPARAKSQGIR